MMFPGLRGLRDACEYKEQGPSIQPIALLPATGWQRPCRLLVRCSMARLGLSRLRRPVYQCSLRLSFPKLSGGQSACFALNDFSLVLDLHASMGRLTYPSRQSVGSVLPFLGTTTSNGRNCPSRTLSPAHLHRGRVVGATDPHLQGRRLLSASQLLVNLLSAMDQ